MMHRDDVLEKVDALLAEYLTWPSWADDVTHLYRLNQLFDGELAPFVHFLALAKVDGQLTAEVWVPADEDPDEWVAAVDAYLGGRISLEPYAPPTLAFSYDVDAIEAITKLREIRATFEEALDMYARPVRSGWIGTKAVTKKPKAKPLGKPVPPHVALYQQRGSKGKRKPW